MYQPGAALRIVSGGNRMNGQYKIGDIVFDNWKLTRFIGEGSFGRVFEADRMDKDFGSIYKSAIKIITIPQNKDMLKSVRAEGMSNENATAFFRGIVEEIGQEINLMSRLDGTANVVGYKDHTVIPHSEGIGWDILIRMELLTPLFDYIDKQPLTRDNIIKLGSDICRALELCEKHSIIHRDVKPENIFVSEAGDFKLGDFGIARTVEKTTIALSKKGTYMYMAPEIYKGAAYGANVDIYSLGLVLYWMLNDNRAPFMPGFPEPITQNDKEAALIRRISGAALPPPRYADNRLADIILKACAYDPGMRYYSARQMREDLDAVLYARDYTAPAVNQISAGYESTVGLFPAAGSSGATERIAHGAGGVPGFHNTVNVHDPAPGNINNAKQGKRAKKSLLPVILSSVAVLAAVIVLVFLLLNRSNNPGSADPTPPTTNVTASDDPSLIKDTPPPPTTPPPTTPPPTSPTPTTPTPTTPTPPPSPPTAVVPDLTGGTEAQIVSAFKALDITPVFEYQENSAPAGTVLFIEKAGMEIVVPAEIIVRISTGPPPPPEPVMSSTAFAEVRNIIRDVEASVYFYETFTGHNQSARGGTNRAISALVNIPVLYSVMYCVDNGYLRMDSTLPYINSGGRGANGRLSGRADNSPASVEDLVYDMLVYSSNSATNTFIEYFRTAPAGTINQICGYGGYGSVDVRNPLGGNDNFATAEDIANMLVELWDKHRDLLTGEFKIVSTDSDANIGLIKDIPSYSALSILNHNGFKNNVYAEAVILYDYLNSDVAYIIIFIGNGGDQSFFGWYAARVGEYIFGVCS